MHFDQVHTIFLNTKNGLKLYLESLSKIGSLTPYPYFLSELLLYICLVIYGCL